MVSQWHILQQMIKNGNNPKEAKELLKKNYEFVASCYKDATIKELANIIAAVQ